MRISYCKQIMFYRLCTVFQLRTDFNLLLMNLICCELLVSVFGIPVDTVAALQHGWDMGPAFCSLVGFTLTTLGQ